MAELPAQVGGVPVPLCGAGTPPAWAGGLANPIQHATQWAGGFPSQAKLHAGQTT